MTQPLDWIDPARRKARGAISNAPSRFDLDRTAVDDGWQRDEDLPPFRTHVTEERPRSIITRNTSPDLNFDRAMNPYRGCEHGCTYCFARPTHAYLGMSPGLDFETQLVPRDGAAMPGTCTPIGGSARLVRCRCAGARHDIADCAGADRYRD